MKDKFKIKIYILLLKMSESEREKANKKTSKRLNRIIIGYVNFIRNIRNDRILTIISQHLSCD